MRTFKGFVVTTTSRLPRPVSMRVDIVPSIPVDEEVAMSRVQLALNMSDLEASVAFYSAMFDVLPHKRRPGYANFAIETRP
jgi:hypothetical protein